MSKILTLTVCLIALGVTLPTGQQKSGQTRENTNWTNVTRAIAESEVVEAFVGIRAIDVERDLKSNLIGVDTLSPSKSIVPFDVDIPKRLVRISFDSVLMKTTVDNSGETIRFIRPMSVYIDQSTHKLIKIVSYRTKQEHKAADLNSIDELEQKLLSKNIDFKGFPDSIAHDFLSVIQNCPFSPETAEKITAIYILDSSRADTFARPIWVISLIGITPLKTTTGPNPYAVPIEMRNFIRVEMDGSTGQVLRASN